MKCDKCGEPILLQARISLSFVAGERDPERIDVVLYSRCCGKIIRILHDVLPVSIVSEDDSEILKSEDGVYGDERLEGSDASQEG